MIIVASLQISGAAGIVSCFDVKGSCGGGASKGETHRSRATTPSAQINYEQLNHL